MRNYSAILFVAIGVFCLSCSKKDNTPVNANPSLNVSPGDNSGVLRGQSGKFSITGNSNASSFSALYTLHVKTLNSGIVTSDSLFKLNGTYFALNYPYQIPYSANIGDNFSFQFILTDISGHTITNNVTLHTVLHSASFTVSPASDQTASSGQTVNYNVVVTPNGSAFLEYLYLNEMDSFSGGSYGFAFPDFTMKQSTPYTVSIPVTIPSGTVKGHYITISFRVNTDQSDYITGNTRRILVN